jgi:hypothetical protein
MEGDDAGREWRVTGGGPGGIVGEAGDGADLIGVVEEEEGEVIRP